MQIADPDDLVPAKTGLAPFALSELARSQGWSDQVKTNATRIRSSVASWQKLRAEAMLGVTASPSEMARGVMSIPEKPAALIATSVAKSTPVQQSRPAASPSSPGPPKSPKAQPVEPESEPKPVAVSPFGKPVAEGQAETKWDISKWIE